jgi:hypothetical protein
MPVVRRCCSRSCNGEKVLVDRRDRKSWSEQLATVTEEQFYSLFNVHLKGTF